MAASLGVFIRRWQSIRMRGQQNAVLNRRRAERHERLGQPKPTFPLPLCFLRKTSHTISAGAAHQPLFVGCFSEPRDLSSVEVQDHPQLTGSLPLIAELGHATASASACIRYRVY